ncbi:hypothetical protein MMC25_008072 [Agyrium rufum]|nr:hypothetical protein [Agyrium rufum]
MRTFPQPITPPQQSSSPPQQHSKKRSRDAAEIDVVDSSNSNAFLSNSFQPLTPPVEPIYGEGMTLINPTTGRIITTAESQTGTWYEEKIEQETLQAAHQAQAAESLALAQVEAPRPKAARNPSHRSLSSDRIIDPLGIHVEPMLAPSIGLHNATWLCNSSDETVRSASRGWAKFIERSYRALDHVEVLMTYDEQSDESRERFIVARTNQGFFRFTEALKRCHSVGDSWESCISNLEAGRVDCGGVGGSSSSSRKGWLMLSADADYCKREAVLEEEEKLRDSSAGWEPYGFECGARSSSSCKPMQDARSGSWGSMANSSYFGMPSHMSTFATHQAILSDGDGSAMDLDS